MGKQQKEKKKNYGIKWKTYFRVFILLYYFPFVCLSVYLSLSHSPHGL